MPNIIDHSTGGKYYGSLPNQRVSSKKKQSKNWQRDTMDYYLNNSSQLNGIRKSKEEIQENWDFYNNIVTSEEIKRSLDPLFVEENGLSSDEAKAFDFYDIIKQPFETLIGEELKRESEVRAFAINPDVLNQKDKEFRKVVYQKFNGLAQQLREEGKQDPKKVKKELEDIDYFLKNDLQTAHEKMANGIIKYINNHPRLNPKLIFNKGFLTQEIIAEQVYKVGHLNKEPDFKLIDSTNFFVFGLGKSNWVQDATAWVYLEYLNPYRIVEEFGEELTPNQIDRIMNPSVSEKNVLIPYTQIYNSSLTLEDALDPQQGAVFIDNDTEFAGMGDSMDDRYVDDNGNIRVARVEWKTLRKIGKLTYNDFDGSEKEVFVGENYKPNEALGEKIKWIYVQELWEGTLILDDIYVKVRPMPVQVRSLNNPFYVRSSYTGFIQSDGFGKAKSRLDRLKPYQRAFNTWMNKLRELWVQHIGKVAIVDTSRIPSDMKTEEWFYWIKKFKLAFENPFEVGKEGAAKGLVSGNMNQNSKTIDLSLAEDINNAINMLNWLENKINQIAAVPEPRQGNMTGKEGLGVSQQAIIQSGHQTQIDFFIHDLIKSQVYELLVEYTKYLWREDNFKSQFVLDDLSMFTLDIQGDKLSEAEFGVKITNSSKMYELTQALDQLAHAAMQTGTASLVDIARMKMSSSPSETLMQLEQAEEKKIKQQQEAQNAQIQAQKEQSQMNVELEQMKLQNELAKMGAKHEMDKELLLIKMQEEEKLHGYDENQNKIEDSVELEMKEKEMQMKEKELETKKELEMAKIKSNEKIAKSKTSAQTK